MKFLEKASILKKLGFKQFDKQIISYIRKVYPTVTMQTDLMLNMGFKVYDYNGKTYVKR